MLFLLQGDGTMQRLDSGRIFQGSNNFTELGVIYPFSGVTLSVAFTLPNGIDTYYTPLPPLKPYTMTDEQTGAKQTFENLYYASTRVPSSVTAMQGTVGVSVLATSTVEVTYANKDGTTTTADEVSQCTSYSASFKVEPSVLPEYTPPASPTTDDFNELVELLTAYQAALTVELNNKQDIESDDLNTVDKTIVGAINEVYDEVTGGESGGGLTARVAAVEEKTEMPLMTDFDVQGNTAQIDFNDGSQKEVRLPGGTSATQPWIRYSANSNGNPMSATPSAEAAYVGFFVGLNPSTNPADYTWSRYKGIAISNVALDGFTFVITYENGDTQEVPIDTEDAIIVHEAGDSLVTSFNGETGDVTGVSSFNGATGEVTGVSSFNGKTGDIEFTTAEQADNVLLPSGEYAAIQAAILDICYPVGSLKFSTSAANPSTYLGGTWVTWGSGRVPVGVDTLQTQFATVEQTGGEVTHTLTISEMPRHFHEINAVGYGSKWQELSAYFVNANENKVPCDAFVNTQREGDSEAHNNLQPYITCYIWKRLA